jgi:hypothetical protein
MRFCRIAVLASLVVLSGAPAMAQFGLYGSPEMLNLSQANPAIVPYDGYTVPVAYPVQLVVSGRYVGGPLEPLSPEPVLLAQASQSAAVAEGPGAVDAMLSNVAYVDDPACCGETACGECGRCGGCGCDDRSCCPWYGLAYALLMGRSNANRVWTSYNWEDESDQEEHTAFGLEWR